MGLIDADSLEEKILKLIDGEEIVFTDEKKPEPKFKVGDRVIVKDPGKKYPSYTGWFENNNVPVRYAAEYGLGACFKELTGTVVFIGPHEYDNHMLVLFESKAKSTFLFDEDGLELDD